MYPKPLSTRDDQHFRFVIEPGGPAEQLRNHAPMQHAKSALSIGNLLAAKRADAPAHPAIHDSSDERHRRNVVHSITENQFRLVCGNGRREEPIDLFRSMLTIGIENDYEINLPIQPVAQTGFDRLAFAPIL